MIHTWIRVQRLPFHINVIEKSQTLRLKGRLYGICTGHCVIESYVQQCKDTAKNCAEH